MTLLGLKEPTGEGGAEMRKTIEISMLCGLIIGCCFAVLAGDPRPIAQPYGGDFEVGEGSYSVERERAAIPIDHLVLGTEHILDQQCHNGGFGWEHADCSATYHNITGPILLGVLGTFYHTRDDSHLVGPVNGGAFDLTYKYDNGEAKFGTYTPMFMNDLARASKNTTFSTHVATGLFDELAAGTYGPDDLDTAGWIAAIETHRSGEWVNLRPWEFSALITVSGILGQPGQQALFEQGILDGLDTLDNSDPDNVYSDIIGIAGAVRGLAAARRLSFPAINAPLHTGIDGIDSLESLAAYLASLQNPNGSWYWHSDIAAPATGDEDVQTTAYALLALLEVDVMTAASYQPATEMTRNWILSMQLPDGGFPKYPGGDENTEIEGEAVTAMADFDAVFFVDGFEAGDTDLWSVVMP
jgi:Prenyltransferase and squalene oxidase repeat